MRTTARLSALLAVLVLALLPALAGAGAPDGVHRVVLDTGLPNGEGSWSLDLAGQRVNLDLYHDATGRLVGTASVAGETVPVTMALTRKSSTWRWSLISTQPATGRLRMKGNLSPASGEATGSGRFRGATPRHGAVTGQAVLNGRSEVTLFLDVREDANAILGVAAVTAFRGSALGTVTVKGRVSARRGVERAVLRLLDDRRRTVVVLSGAVARGSFSGKAQIRLPSIRGRVPFTMRDGGPVRTDDRVVVAADDESITRPGGSAVLAARDELVLVLRRDATPAETAAIEAHLRELGVAVVGGVPETRLLQLAVSPSADEFEIAEALRGLSGVAFADVNEVVELLGEPENPLPPLGAPVAKPTVSKRRAAAKVGVPSFEGDWWIEAIHAGDAWDVTTGSAGASAVIGIIDTGLPADQDAIAADRLTRLDGSGAPIAGDGSAVTEDGRHGTHVASFAAGYRDDLLIDVRGVAWTSRVVAVDPFGVTHDGKKLVRAHRTDLHEAVKTALRAGAKVVNVSYGPEGSDAAPAPTEIAEKEQNWRDFMTSAVEAAADGEFDAVVVLAAGNAAFHEDDQLLTTADIGRESVWRSNALIVAACDEDLQYGRWVGGGTHLGSVIDLAAPGVEIHYRDRGLFSSVPLNGTSIAAPLVTGTLSLVRGVAPDLTAPEARHALLAAAPRTVGTPRGQLALLDAEGAVRDAVTLGGVEREMLDPPVSLTKGAEEVVTVRFVVPDSLVPKMDVLFLIDVSGSYGDDIDTLQAKAGAIIDEIRSRGIDVRFGVGSFSDYPIGSWGSASSGDRAFILDQAVTDDDAALLAAIGGLDQPSILYGGDWRESQYEALYQAATGAGRDVNGDGDFDDVADIAPQAIGWRTGALKVIVLATDAPFHSPTYDVGYPGPTFGTTAIALEDAGAVVIGLDSGDTQGDLDAIAAFTGGATYALSSDAAEIAEGVRAGIDTVLRSLEVRLEEVAPAGWVRSVEPAVVVAPTRGQEIEFHIRLQGIRERADQHEQKYFVPFWVTARGSAVLRRVLVPITVPAAAR